MRGITQRHSLPQPGEVKGHGGSVLRPRSFWFKPQRNTQDEFESIPGGWCDPLPTTGDLDVNTIKGNGWRDSAQSVTSNGTSTTSLHETRPRSDIWGSSDRFSNGSSSSVLTRFSGSTASTSLTLPSPGTTSKRSSRGSVLQREKRFSSAKSELHTIRC